MSTIFSVYFIGVFVYAMFSLVWFYLDKGPLDKIDWSKLIITSLIWPAIVIAGLWVFVSTFILEMLRNGK